MSVPDYTTAYYLLEAASKCADDVPGEPFCAAATALATVGSITVGAHTAHTAVQKQKQRHKMKTLASQPVNQ